MGIEIGTLYKAGGSPKRGQNPKQETENDIEK